MMSNTDDLGDWNYLLAYEQTDDELPWVTIGENKMLEKRINNNRKEFSKYFVSFTGEYLYLNVGIRRLWEERFPDLRIANVYVDAKARMIKIELSEDGEYILCSNDKSGKSGYKICLYNARHCGIVRGKHYPVEFSESENAFTLNF